MIKIQPDLLKCKIHYTVPCILYTFRYYFNHSATVDDFLNTTIMDALDFQIDTVKTLVEKYLPKTPIWIGT